MYYSYYPHVYDVKVVLIVISCGVRRNLTYFDTSRLNIKKMSIRLSIAGRAQLKTVDLHKKDKIEIQHDF